MDTSHWPQGIGVARPVENPNPVEKKPRPQREQALNCPRCNSTNTKFCYYNNYSLSQPRYFCKTCRRYWTEGGTLRNVPVGGVSRKKHRSSSSSSPSSSISCAASKKPALTDPSPPKISLQNPKIHHGHDINFGKNLPFYNGIPELVALPFSLDPQNPNISSANSPHLPFMELLKTAGSFGSGRVSSLVSGNPVSGSDSVFSSGLPLHEFKPSSSFSLDGLGILQSTAHDQASSSRIGLPFDEPKPVLNSEFEQDRVQLQVDSTGYWNGMLSGGSW